ncbi:Ribosomal-protein-alanine acetyltransferase [Bacillus thuringiensis serovar israelensis ATCC 35646]|nr:Ribosomal-protein-alanine acetyltransferase [Bacillus thuringiensis serovar israelensis ATCC 35646]
MFPILKTDRLILRELTEEDAPRILQCFSNTNVLRYYGQKPLQDVDQVKQSFITLSSVTMQETLDSPYR